MGPTTAKPNLNEVDMETPTLPMMGTPATPERAELVTGGHLAGSSNAVGRHSLRKYDSCHYIRRDIQMPLRRKFLIKDNVLYVLSCSDSNPP